MLVQPIGVLCQNRRRTVQILAVIPARFGAQRFPGKPLADLGGRPVIQWVYEAACSCPHFDAVVVATDDERIAACVQSFGGEVEMTRGDHPSGSDRVAEVAQRRAEAGVVVNVQGDQPFAEAAMLTALIQPYLDGERPAMTTLACPLAPEARDDPNTVKVVCDLAGNAMYFSRSLIPSSGPALQHVGLYAFTRNALLRFPALEPTALERQERLEQLRALEHGFEIRVCRTERPVIEINTPEDLEAAAPMTARRP
jgi:3-deoxy-manno-octulosonate cytidylyltransferase (CMP-KDO synthetase)